MPEANVLAAAPTAILAGMPPPPALDEIAALRLDVLSFLGMVFLLSAWGVKGVWNAFSRPAGGPLPVIGYGRSLALTTVWALLFVLVLSMISGARELLTPGAWERNGITYRLSQGGDRERILHVRRQSMERLRAALWSWAASRKGELPPHDFVAEIPAELWVPPDPSGVRYIYLPGAKVDRGSMPVAYEPGVFGPVRMTLYSDGRIAETHLREILSSVAGERAD